MPELDKPIYGQQEELLLIDEFDVRLPVNGQQVTVVGVGKIVSDGEYTDYVPVFTEGHLQSRVVKLGVEDVGQPFAIKGLTLDNTKLVAKFGRQSAQDIVSGYGYRPDVVASFMSPGSEVPFLLYPKTASSAYYDIWRRYKKEGMPDSYSRKGVAGSAAKGLTGLHGTIEAYQYKVGQEVETYPDAYLFLDSYNGPKTNKEARRVIDESPLAGTLRLINECVEIIARPHISESLGLDFSNSLESLKIYANPDTPYNILLSEWVIEILKLKQLALTFPEIRRDFVGEKGIRFNGLQQPLDVNTLLNTNDITIDMGTFMRPVQNRGKLNEHHGYQPKYNSVIVNLEEGTEIILDKFGGNNQISASEARSITFKLGPLIKFDPLIETAYFYGDLAMTEGRKLTITLGNGETANTVIIPKGAGALVLDTRILLGDYNWLGQGLTILELPTSNN
jgi:hypothetical protein